MRLLYLTDRLSRRGGADLHLRQVMAWAVAEGHEVAVACGRAENGVGPPRGVTVHTMRGLGSKVASSARLAGLDGLVTSADLVHIQNVMNPVAIRRAVATGRAVATVQDHRVLCPAVGKTLPDGRRCAVPMAEEPCRRCLPDGDYLERTLALTRSRRDALRGARLVVLSRFMADELAAVGLEGAEVIPPWTAAGPPRTSSGEGVAMGGRLVSHKGIADGWRAWREAGRPMPLRVAGEGPAADGLAGAEVLGWLDGEGLRRLLRGSRMLLFPAVWQEPFGILGVEALAEGTPVVVADVGGTREWSGAGCVRVAAGDVAAMAEAVSRLAADAGAARALGESGRRFVRDRFTCGRLAPRLARVYSGAAGKGG